MPNKTKIREHYDLLSPYYHSLWGIHIHHGLWKNGRETPVQAQNQLTRELVKLAQLKAKDNIKVLDVGCGLGGSGIFLAKNLSAQVTGISISSLQIELARKFAREAGVDVDFRVMDADNLLFSKVDEFDCIWSIEAISHFSKREKFFKDASYLLRSGGLFVLADWFKRENLTAEDQKNYIIPIEKGMLVKLSTISDYCLHLEKSGCLILKNENISQLVARTWDFGLDIIKNKNLWALALKQGKEIIGFLKAFQAMKRGYKSGTLEYDIIIARKL